MYDPTLGRWMTEDPTGFAGGDANLYRYVRNDPTNLVDPSGEEGEEVKRPSTEQLDAAYSRGYSDWGKGGFNEELYKQLSLWEAKEYLVGYNDARFKLRNRQPSERVQPAAAKGKNPVAQVLKEASGANLQKIPGSRLNKMVEQGLAQRTASGYVYVKFAAPTGTYNLLYEPMGTVFVNYKRGVRTTNHYVKEYRSLLGKDYLQNDVAYYKLVYMGSATRAVKGGIGGSWTTINPADSPTPGEDVERQWKIDQKNRAYEAGVMAKSEFFSGLVPFRNTIKYWNENSAFENTLNLTGDVLLFLGPLSRVFAGANTARQILRITIAAEAALGVARAGQGVYDITYGDGKNATRFFSEAALRLLGVSAATLQLLKAPKFTPGKRTGLAFTESVSDIPTGKTVSIKSNQVFGMGDEIITPSTPAPGGAHHYIFGKYDAASGNLYIDMMSTTQPGRGIGTEMLSRAIEAIGPDKVKSLSGELAITNLRTYQGLRAGGASVLDAVWGTPFGKTARKLGFDALKFDETSKVATFYRK